MNDTILNWISVFGSLASIVGICLTYRQVKAVKKVADAAKEASELTQQSIFKTLSTVQVTKYCESIFSIQNAINEDEIKLAIHYCHELKTALIELQESLSSLNESRISGDLSVHIQTLGINITNMHKSLPNQKDKLRKEKVVRDLENLHNQMSEILAKLKLNIN